jgi:hypothetical protein
MCEPLSWTLHTHLLEEAAMEAAELGRGTRGEGLGTRGRAENKKNSSTHLNAPSLRSAQTSVSLVLPCRGRKKRKIDLDLVTGQRVENENYDPARSSRLRRSDPHRCRALTEERINPRHGSHQKVPSLAPAPSEEVANRNAL